ncbi:MAG: ubiquinol-cytochrome c reductase iron-sulfur subunit [Haloarculaceae archaeon]
MPVDEDKYPSESGRRRFVKGVVGSAALASVGVGGAAAINTATNPSGIGGGITKFIGIENVAGPAPRGMPIIPIEIDSDGALKGVWPKVQTKTEQGKQVQVAETSVGGYDYKSTWFQYCGVQNYTGIEPEPQADVTNFFKSAAGSPYGWQGDSKSAGDKLFVDDFSDYRQWGNGIGTSGLGKPAMATWRSDAENVQTIPVQVLRSTEIEKLAAGKGKYADLPDAVHGFVDAATDQGFIAWLDKCTHFCCVPGFKASPASEKFEAENEVYCPCHQSVYDPFSPVEKSFVALPRPEDNSS